MNIVQRLTEIISEQRVLTGESLLERYHHIWKMHEPLQALAVVLPESTAEVSQIMQLCHSAEHSVIVFGGLTNLVGATETNGDEIIVSLERMTSIHEIDIQSRTMTVDAGVILESILAEADEYDLLFPLNFGAKGSARIGGVIATNAGGLRVFKYGMTRQLVLGLEVIL
ncbi:MAG: FAD-binding oxidoreductase, partial [Bacteroidota bacterium]